ncbi:MAG: NAD(P)-dependent oxidoreductase [Microbacteriaceae bacterium]
MPNQHHSGAAARHGALPSADSPSADSPSADLPSADLPSVGFVGVGNMGQPMALNVLNSGRACAVQVYGRSSQRLERVVAAGAVACPTPRRLAEASDVIFSVLPDLPELETLLHGETGILAGIDSPTLLVISSTSSPDGVRELAARLTRDTQGLLRAMDAPVSGGPEGAASATLSIMVGAAADDFALAESVLSAMGTPVLLGPLGSGQVAKACNQLIVASTMLALGEASVIAERCGLDLATLLPLLQGGYAGGRLLDTRVQRLIDKDYSVLAAAKYLLKDLGFAAAEAQNTGTIAPQLAATRAAYIALVERGFGDQDISVTQAYVSSL